jgi:hypothetical protein
MQPSRKPLSTQVFQGFKSLTLRHSQPYGALGSSRSKGLPGTPKLIPFERGNSSLIPSGRQTLLTEGGKAGRPLSAQSDKKAHSIL